MTRQKKFKKRVRARAQERGESYVRARGALDDGRGTKASYRLIGYWKSIEEPHWPDPADMVDASWSPDERAKVVAHLRSGYVAEHTFGSSWCRLGCGSGKSDARVRTFFAGTGTSDNKLTWTERLQARKRAGRRAEDANMTGEEVDMGALELSDGTYVWPEGLAHYVEKHNVRLPQEFVDHVLQGVLQEEPSHASGEFDYDERWWRDVAVSYRVQCLMRRQREEGGAFNLLWRPQAWAWTGGTEEERLALLEQVTQEGTLWSTPQRTTLRYSEQNRLLPLPPGAVVGRGDFKLRVTDAEGCPCPAREVSYTLYQSGAKHRVIGEENRTPVTLAVGEYSAEFTVPEQSTPTRYKVVWRYTVEGFYLEPQYLTQVFEIESETKTIDWREGAVQQLHLTGDVRLHFIAPEKHGTYVLEITQDDKGGHIIFWPEDVRWPDQDGRYFTPRSGVVQHPALVPGGRSKWVAALDQRGWFAEMQGGLAGFDETWTLLNGIRAPSYVEILSPFGAGWYYYETDYPNDGSVGPYRCREDAEQAVVLAGYEMDSVSFIEQAAPAQVSQKYLVDHLRNQVAESLAAFEGAKRDEEIERRMHELLSERLVSWTREMATMGVLAPPEEDVTVEFTSGTTLQGVIRIRNPERYPQFVRELLEHGLVDPQYLVSSRLKEGA